MIRTLVRCTIKLLQNNPFDTVLDQRYVEVDQQPEAKPGELQVGQDLRFIDSIHLLYGLDF